jgi:hypothetical protein
MDEFFADDRKLDHKFTKANDTKLEIDWDALFEGQSYGHDKAYLKKHFCLALVAMGVNVGLAWEIAGDFGDDICRFTRDYEIVNEAESRTRLADPAGDGGGIVKRYDKYGAILVKARPWERTLFDLRKEKEND